MAIDKKWTISNIITISRLILLPFIVYFLLQKMSIIAFIFMLVSLLSDAIDGYIARKFHQESNLGKFLDPLCDKISLAVVLVTLLLINAVPSWMVILIVARDFLILLGSYIILRQRSVVFKSNLWGKITGFLFGGTILAFTINFRSAGMLLLYITIPIMMITFVTYVQRYILKMKGEI